MQAKADELLQRGQWMKIARIALVSVDLAYGINEVHKTSAKLTKYKEELERIVEDYVRPIINSFKRTGRFDKHRADLALVRLHNIKEQCEDAREKSKSWAITHFLNGIAMGLEAYATFTDIGKLAFASAAVLKSSPFWIGTVEGTLSIGSFVLSATETYDYVQYKNIIADVAVVIDTLEEYQRESADNLSIYITDSTFHELYMQHFNELVLGCLCVALTVFSLILSWSK